HADPEIAGPETVGRLAESRDRTRDRAGGEKPEEKREAEREDRDQEVVTIGLDEGGLNDRDRLAQLPLGRFLVALDERKQPLHGVREDPTVEKPPGCLRIRLRALLELPQQRAVHRDLVV